MNNPTPTESCALARDGRVTVVRPMEEQSWLGVSRSEYDGGLFHGQKRGPMGVTFHTFEAPHRPGDFQADGSRVVSVEPMRLHDTSILCAHRDGLNVVDRWNETYGHRPDWRYEANPWCWVTACVIPGDKDE